MLFIELWLKNYIASWGQTWGTSNFDLQVRSVLAFGSEKPGVEKTKKIITPKDPPVVVSSGFFVKNYTGFCYRGIFIMDSMGSYVPNISRRVLGILVSFGGEPLPRSCLEFFFSKILVLFLIFVRPDVFRILFFGHFSI